MKRIIAIIALIVISTFSTSAMDAIRVAGMSSSTSIKNITLDLTVRVYTASNDQVWFTDISGVNFDNQGVFSFVLNPADLTYNSLYKVTIENTSNGIILFESRLDKIVMAQSQFGANLDLSEMNLDGTIALDDVLIQGGLNVNGIAEFGNTLQIKNNLDNIILHSGSGHASEGYLKTQNSAGNSVLVTLGSTMTGERGAVSVGHGADGAAGWLASMVYLPGAEFGLTGSPLADKWMVGTGELLNQTGVGMFYSEANHEGSFYMFDGSFGLPTMSISHNGDVYAAGDLTVDGTIKNATWNGDLIDAAYLPSETDPIYTTAALNIVFDGDAADGDLSGTYPNPSLKAVGTAGTYGDATTVPVITTDTKGRVTAVTATAINFPAEVDGVIGNEVIDAADATLTRSGTGIVSDPYKLALNLTNPNQWTGLQTFQSTIAFEGTTVDGNDLTVGAIDPTVPRTINFPDVDGIVMVRDDNFVKPSDPAFVAKQKTFNFLPLWDVASQQFIQSKIQRASYTVPTSPATYTIGNVYNVIDEGLAGARTFGGAPAFTTRFEFGAYNGSYTGDVTVPTNWTSSATGYLTIYGKGYNGIGGTPREIVKLGAAAPAVDNTTEPLGDNAGLIQVRDGSVSGFNNGVRGAMGYNSTTDEWENSIGTYNAGDKVKMYWKSNTDYGFSVSPNFTVDQDGDVLINGTVSGTNNLVLTTTLAGLETDPEFTASAAHGITGTQITNWDAAYGWGNHAGLYTPLAHKTTEDAINGLVYVNGSGTYAAATAGTGISIVTGQVTNTAPDQIVALTGGGITGISGTYPNFTITSTETDPQVGAMSDNKVAVWDDATGSLVNGIMTDDGTKVIVAGDLTINGRQTSTYSSSAAMSNGIYSKTYGTSGATQAWGNVVEAYGHGSGFATPSVEAVLGVAKWDANTSGAATDQIVGVVGVAEAKPTGFSGSVTAIGVVGEAINVNAYPNVGVYGFANNSTVQNFGIIGLANTSTPPSVGAMTAGVVGYNANSGATDYAGYFVGDVKITGNTSVGGLLTNTATAVTSAPSVPLTNVYTVDFTGTFDFTFTGTVSTAGTVVYIVITTGTGQVNALAATAGDVWMAVSTGTSWKYIKL